MDSLGGRPAEPNVRLWATSLTFLGAFTSSPRRKFRCSFGIVVLDRDRQTKIGEESRTEFFAIPIASRARHMADEAVFELRCKLVVRCERKVAMKTNFQAVRETKTDLPSAA
jgi:hypothetical protein